MTSGKAPLRTTFFAHGGTWNHDRNPGTLEQADAAATIPLWLSEGRTSIPGAARDSQPVPDLAIDSDPHHDNSVLSPGADLTLADFVETVFVPQHAAAKRPAGRAHLKGILKHVLIPSHVARAFQLPVHPSRGAIKQVHGWPYLGAMRLAEIRPYHVQAILNTALERGYSTQTATHIRSVVSLIFSHARKSGHFQGENPAARVTLPAVVHGERHALTIDQLADLIRIMRYPERELSLLTTLTAMNVSEICGLQWKYVNLSDSHRMVDGERIAPRTIAIRRQSSRCELQDVIDHRKRELAISDLLLPLLENIKRRGRHASGKDFVLASRNGTPINQDNIAARRLKEIGRRRGMPWLSWQVFHRTRARLDALYGVHLERELQTALRLTGPAGHPDTSEPLKPRKKTAPPQTASTLSQPMHTLGAT